MGTLTDTADLTREQISTVENINILFEEAAKNRLLPDTFKYELGLMHKHVTTAAYNLPAVLASVASYDTRWAYGSVSEQARRRFSRSLAQLLRRMKQL